MVARNDDYDPNEEEYVDHDSGDDDNDDDDDNNKEGLKPLDLAMVFFVAFVVKYNIASNMDSVDPAAALAHHYQNFFKDVELAPHEMQILTTIGTEIQQPTNPNHLLPRTWARVEAMGERDMIYAERIKRAILVESGATPEQGMHKQVRNHIVDAAYQLHLGQDRVEKCFRTFEMTYEAARRATDSPPPIEPDTDVPPAAK